MKNRLLRCAGGSLLLGMVLAGGCRPAHEWRGEVVDPPAAVDLAGTNWDGEPFRLGDLEGKVTVLFFGYTYCPDVCPFTLARMKELYGRLGERAEEVAVVFVSVDPRRDSVAKLASYVPNFDRRFYGLHLDPAQLDSAKEGFDLTIQYGQPKDGPGTDSYYYVDHTGSLFVIDRQGRLRLRFPPNSSADELLPDVEALLAG
ncbi:MAG: SCO family protein [Acidobacteria bacterium]|nr:MAG: SCO family protein [Acidobacteriota bacterium]